MVAEKMKLTESERYDEVVALLSAFNTYCCVRGVGAIGQFDFSIRTYVHYTTELTIEIMENTYNYVKGISKAEHQICLLAQLYYAAKNDMIELITKRGNPVPKVFYKIEKLYNQVLMELDKKYFPELLKKRRD